MGQADEEGYVKSRLEDDLYKDPHNLPTSIMLFILVVFLVFLGIAGLVIWILAQSAGTGGFGYG